MGTNGDFLERIQIPEDKEHENAIGEPKSTTSEKCNACNESTGTTERRSFRICQIKVNVHNYNKSSGTLCSTCSMQYSNYSCLDERFSTREHATDSEFSSFFVTV